MLIHSIIQVLLKSPKFPGRDYLIEKLPKWFIKPAVGRVVLTTRFGFKIELDPIFDKNIENVIYERGVYEQGTVSAIRDLLEPGQTFVDVGANIGFLSLVGSNQVGSSGNVFAFEPFPSTLEILKTNKRINEFDQMHIYEFALGSSNDSQMIYSEASNRGGASIINKHSSEGVKIDIKKLDDITIDQKIDLIKIDVEGFEFEVLKGAENRIKKDCPKLIIEYSIDRENSIESYEMYNWLLQLKLYRIYKLKQGKERASKMIEIKSEADLPVHDNIFCLPI